MRKIIYSLIVLSFLSCKKDNDTSFDNDLILSSGDSDVVSENNKMDNIFDDLHGVSEKGKTENESTNTRVGAVSCPSVSLVDTVLTLDFGTGCLYNYKQRKGKIEIHFTGRYRDQGTVVITKLIDYEVQDIRFGTGFVKLDGEHVVENLGLIDGDMTWSVNVTDGKVTYSDGSVSTWNTSRTRTLVSEGTTAPFDETYRIEGYSNGITKNGTAYSMEISTSNPLIFDWECWFQSNMPKSGEITLFEEGAYDRSIDYSYNKSESEDCDRSVKVTYGTISLNLDL